MVWGNRHHPPPYRSGLSEADAEAAYQVLASGESKVDSRHTGARQLESVEARCEVSG